MKVLNKMQTGVDYVVNGQTITLNANETTFTNEALKDNPVFQTHLKNNAVEIVGEETIDTKEAYRQELLQKCKDRGIKVNPNTGITKLEKALKDNSDNDADADADADTDTDNDDDNNNNNGGAE